MGPRPQYETARPSLMWFFVALGLLLLISTMLPSCHSRRSQWPVSGRIQEGHAALHYSQSPPPPAPSPTPPAKPATPPPPPPPHH